MRVAVVGHVEWCEFAEVPQVPHAGEIVHASHTFEEPAGGGAVAAVQLEKLAGEATLFTAFGDDETGHRSEAELREHGLRVEAGFHPEPQRRAFVHLDTAGERTITVLGPRLGPSGADELPWELLDDTDAVYVTAGDVEAVRQARRARTLVATPRGLDTLADAHVQLDALVSSGRDPGERYRPGDLDPPPRVVVRTLGAAGGEWETAGGERGRWGPAPLPGPVRDAYGCGDSFAAGLTYGLGAGWSADRAVELAARCGAACLTGRGPYEAQLRLTD
jgi:ribokinase